MGTLAKKMVASYRNVLRDEGQKTSRYFTRLTFESHCFPLKAQHWIAGASGYGCVNRTLRQLDFWMTMLPPCIAVLGLASSAALI